MLTTTKIPREKLEDFFNSFSRHFLKTPSTVHAEVEVLSADRGDQHAAEGVTLTGITFDPKDDAVELAYEGGVHRVDRPVEVWAVEETNGFVKAIEIVRLDNTREVIRIRDLAPTT